MFIEFEGIRQGGDFYVNGKAVGFHENGVTAFGFDITDLVHFDGQENIIAARIDNDWNYRERATNSKYQWEDKNFNANYGGIIRNVFYILHPDYIKPYHCIPTLKLRAYIFMRVILISRGKRQPSTRLPK